jgi:hypothetical protein
MQLFAVEGELEKGAACLVDTAAAYPYEFRGIAVFREVNSVLEQHTVFLRARVVGEVFVRLAQDLV